MHHFPIETAHKWSGVWRVHLQSNELSSESAEETLHTSAALNAHTSFALSLMNESVQHRRSLFAASVESKKENISVVVYITLSLSLSRSLPLILQLTGSRLNSSDQNINAARIVSHTLQLYLNWILHACVIGWCNSREVPFIDWLTSFESIPSTAPCRASKAYELSWMKSVQSNSQ